MTESFLTASAGAIAVTGNIGSGKSKVARWLGQRLAVPVYSADDEVKSLLDQGEPGWIRLRELLGNKYFDNGGRLDKPKLREAIFADRSLRGTVEHLIHPLVLEALRQKTVDFTAPCLVEVPLLFEANWQHYFAKILVVFADDGVCVRRIMDRDKIGQGRAMAALHAQDSIQRKISLADFSVNNSGAWNDTVAQLESIIKQAPLIQKKTLDTLRR